MFLLLHGADRHLGEFVHTDDAAAVTSLDVLPLLCGNVFNGRAVDGDGNGEFISGTDFCGIDVDLFIGEIYFISYGFKSLVIDNSILCVFAQSGMRTAPPNDVIGVSVITAAEAVKGLKSFIQE